MHPLHCIRVAIGLHPHANGGAPERECMTIRVPMPMHPRTEGPHPRAGGAPYACGCGCFRAQLALFPESPSETAMSCHVT